MQTATNAKIASDNSLSGLTYLDTLVSGATAQGLYYIVIDNNKITADMISSLTGLGYTVSKQDSDNSSFIRYIISWE